LNIKYKNILISIQAHRGDFIWATSAFTILKKTYPGIKITVIAPYEVKELIVNNPVIDCVIYSPFSDNNVKSKIKKIIWILKITPKIFFKRFDLLLNFDSLKAAIFIAKIARIPHIIGGDLFFAGYNIISPLFKYYTGVIELLKHQDYIHGIVDYQTIVKSYFGIFNSAMPVLPDSSKYTQNALNLIKDNSKLIVALCVRGEKNSVNIWGIENFKSVIEFLNNKFHSISFYIVGSKRDFSYAQEIVTKPNIYNICGKTSLLELKEFLQKIHLLISIDTGTIHMAAVADTNIISIHGPTSPARARPVSHKAVSFHCAVDCFPCLYRTLIEKKACPTYNKPKCLESITPERIADAASDILETIYFK
jgi:ADP-heptose:LPS heptosyltransferase